MPNSGLISPQIRPVIQLSGSKLILMTSSKKFTGRTKKLIKIRSLKRKTD